MADAGTGEAILCAIRGTGRTLDFALREARETGRRLYLLFVREQRFMTEQDTKRKWQEDPEASQILTEGLVITVEPIIAAGSGRAFVAADGWTVRTADRRASAHFEHTLMITKGEPILLTAA